MIKKNSVNYLLLFSIIILCLFGLLMIYSSSSVWASYKFNDAFKYVKNQGLFFLIGMVMMYYISKVNYHFFEINSSKIFIVAVILLVLVLIPGIGTIRNGSRSWFGIGSFGVQPSEFMKIAMIIFVSKYLTKNNYSLKNNVLPILLVLLSIFGLIMLQPDFGTGTIIIMTVIGLLFVSGVSMKLFVRFIFLGMFGVIGLVIAAPYRLARILSFLNPWSDPLGSGFQIIQSLYAIGPGGLLGYGLFNSRQKHFYLPEPQTDFIFAIITEELGFLGAIIVICLFVVIIINSLKTARASNDLFGKYLAFGISFQIAFQTILNLMVVTGLIPVTGVTLPFLSYGGSSLLITLLEFGIILNISRYQK